MASRVPMLNDQIWPAATVPESVTVASDVALCARALYGVTVSVGAATAAPVFASTRVVPSTTAE